MKKKLYFFLHSLLLFLLLFSYFEKFTSFYKDIEFPIFYVQKFIDSHL